MASVRKENGAFQQRFRLDQDALSLLVIYLVGAVRAVFVDAPSFAVSANEEKQILAKNSLARFPNVGAIMATASDAESHEWDAIEQGVFTHELISALRGAADVNGDGKIEYSEASAFFNAAA